MYSSATVGCRQLSRQAGAVRELSSGAAFVQTSRWLAVMQKLAETVIRQPENGKNRPRSKRETGLKASKRNYDYWGVLQRGMFAQYWNTQRRKRNLILQKEVRGIIHNWGVYIYFSIYPLLFGHWTGTDTVDSLSLTYSPEISQSHIVFPFTKNDCENWKSTALELNCGFEGNYGEATSGTVTDVKIIVWHLLSSTLPKMVLQKLLLGWDVSLEGAQQVAPRSTNSAPNPHHPRKFWFGQNL